MIIWLASYPKSGNTWIRSFLASILYTPNGETNLEGIKKLQQYPLKRQFDGLIKEKFDLNNLSKNWIKSQEIINSKKKFRFLKTHHSMCNVNGNMFTNYQNSLGVIYIVRDPRNVVTSVLNYYGLKDYNEAKKFIFHENMFLEEKEDNEHNNRRVFTLVSSWSNNYNSWKNFKKNLLLLKYEDLLSNPIREFNKVRKFLFELTKFEINEKKFITAVNENSFEKLKNTENKYGFDGWVESKKRKKNFFNLGPKNDYKKILDKTISDEIEKKFYNEMKELNYL